MSQAMPDEAIALDCFRQGATLFRAYLNIALLPSLSPLEEWGGGGGGRGEMKQR